MPFMEYEEYDLARKEISEKYRKRSKRENSFIVASLFPILMGFTGVQYYDNKREELKEFYPIVEKKVTIEETLGKLEQAKEHLENIVGSSYRSDSVQRIKELQDNLDGGIKLLKKDLESITAEPQFKRYENQKEKNDEQTRLSWLGTALGFFTLFISYMASLRNKHKRDKELSNLKSKYELKEFMRSSLDVSGYN